MEYEDNLCESDQYRGNSTDTDWMQQQNKRTGVQTFTSLNSMIQLKT